ncbi:MAG: DUF6265 family protein [Cyclobacteriaceae bacterium]
MSRDNNYFFLIAILFLLVNCSAPSPVENMKWLEGNWTQVNQSGKRLSLESWQYENGELLGKGYTVIKDNDHYDTIFAEKLRIIVREKTLFYEADLPTEDPILFRLTESNEDSWNFSNPTHDFPKYITYQKTENGFKALVGDGTKEIVLEFEKI